MPNPFPQFQDQSVSEDPRPTLRVTQKSKPILRVTPKPYARPLQVPFTSIAKAKTNALNNAKSA